MVLVVKVILDVHHYKLGIYQSISFNDDMILGCLLGMPFEHVYRLPHQLVNFYMPTDKAI